MFGTVDPEPPKIAAVEEPDYYAAHVRLGELKRQHERHMHDAWIGALVINFTNDELIFLSDILSIGETLDLRRLGLIGPDDGFDGSKASRKKIEERGRAWTAKLAAAREASERAAVKRALT